MEIDYIALFVTNVERSVAFYQQALGFEFTKPAKSDGAEGRSGQLRIGIYDRRWLTHLLGEQGTESIGHLFLLSMTVPDLEATHQHLQQLGVNILKPPQDMVWGQRILLLADPDHNLLEIVQRSPSSE
ncbi:MAG: VOC family protein [Aphanocapsa sp. GSE-SYN-MK-11-07L]|jgi:lactoylglutathione lyase|nr:VOC family protein [Aphanocapsa sp. GSE-SYN-MK-11-07L]